MSEEKRGIPSCREHYIPDGRCLSCNELHISHERNLWAMIDSLETRLAAYQKLKEATKKFLPVGLTIEQMRKAPNHLMSNTLADIFEALADIERLESEGEMSQEQAMDEALTDAIDEINKLKQQLLVASLENKRLREALEKIKDDGSIDFDADDMSDCAMKALSSPDHSQLAALYLELVVACKADNSIPGYQFRIDYILQRIEEKT